MRLLNTSTLNLKEFVRDIPPYVILSHTWGEGEVQFDDISKPHAQYMPGYQKILSCCQRAREDGFDYIWIDTCSIDKRSSSELSEAINSMYRYYLDAEICYAYLCDVPSDEDASIPGSKFERSRWFTRGWTLQELLAPDVVEFYSSDWQWIGTKRSHIKSIERATGIAEVYLSKHLPLKTASAAQKFSWASSRETTREEDIAYCLMGILDVNMPLLYGEGRKAFIRLQTELIKQTNEHTFLCWQNAAGKHLISGPFCSSPQGFKDCKNILDNPVPIKYASHTLTNRGLEIQLPCISTSCDHLAILNCMWHFKDGPGNLSRVGIWLQNTGNDIDLRIGDRKPEIVDYSKVTGATVRNLCISGEVFETTRGGFTTREPIMQPKHSQKTTCKTILRGIDSAENILKFETMTIGRKHNYTSVPDFQELFAYPPEIEIHDNQCVGLLLSYNSMAFLVAIGQKESVLWANFFRGISFFAVKESLKGWFYQTGIGSHPNATILDGGIVTRSVEDDAVIYLQGKKTWHRDAACWKADIKIKAPPA